MSNPGEEQVSPSSVVVFINYYVNDTSYAHRLYLDLKAASLSPWIDKENLLPGQIRHTEIEKAIRASRYFVALLSTRSINERGDAQKQINTALDVQSEFPESKIFFIPARLDKIDVPFKLKNLQFVDLFPIWEEGLKKILKAMNINQEQIESIIQHQDYNSPFTASDISFGVLPNQVFKGEKRFFVGRENYINQRIKSKLGFPGSRVSLVGPGGSGKSQLAFKAIHEYVKEGIFDPVIPLYFDEGLITFDKFLLQIAVILGLKAESFETNTTLEKRKDIIGKLLSNKKHPLIYLDNFETVSFILNREASTDNKESRLNSNLITDFLNNIVPTDNTSILVTSRERKNNLTNEELIDLEGLSIDDSMKLFNAFVRPVFKNPKGETKDRIEDILKKTGGHPLSIEIIAKNLRGVHELEKVSHNLGELKGDPTQSEERFQTLKACFDYTIDKLDDKLQRLLPKLTLFSSPFPISAAVEIFDASENDILDLYDRSLLKSVDSDEIYGKVQGPDYWLYNFHPAIRGYVEDAMINKKQSSRDLELEYGERFSKYYFKLLGDIYNSLGKENHTPALAQFNIIFHGKENDFEKAIGLTTDRVLGARILNTIGIIMSREGLFQKSLEYVEKSMYIFEEINDKQKLMKIYENRGSALSRVGRYDEALEYINKSLRIGEELNDRWNMAQTYGSMGGVFIYMGRLEEALEYSNKSLRISEELNDRKAMVASYGNKAIVLGRMGRLEEALEYHVKVSQIYENEFNDRFGMGRAYTNIGVTLRKMFRLEEALEYINKALEIDEEQLNRTYIANNCGNAANVLVDMGRYEEALEYINKALHIEEELNDRWLMARDYRVAGIVLNNRERFDEAFEHLERAMKISQELNDEVNLAEVYSATASVFSKRKDYSKALQYHKRSLKIHEELYDRIGMAQDHYNMNFVYVVENKKKEALKCVYKAIEVLEEFKKESKYYHPLLRNVNKQLSYLMGSNSTKE